MFSDPKEILSQVQIMPGWTVCDIGAGTGYYSLPLSLLVGDKGKVYAVDVQKTLLDKIASEARAQHRNNIEIVWGNAEKVGGTKLRDGLCDMVIVANVLFQIEQKDPFIDELKRLLKPGGSVLIVDWTGSFNNLGPHPSSVVSEATAKSLFEKHGFVYSRGLQAGAHHYGMILKKA